MRRNRAARDAREREAAQRAAATLAGALLEITARAGEGGKLFGSVTSADIAEALLARHGLTVDRRRIALAEPLKELGDVEVPVQLHPEVSATVTVAVVAG
jgi:large subunit ribosomal protein L9